MKKISQFLLIPIIGLLLTSWAQAEIISFKLNDHPNGGAANPTYGLRLDGLLDLNSNSIFTFSFDHAQSNMQLDYNTTTNEIHIFGNAYGGLDIGSTYDSGLSGLVSIDFTYRNNVTSDFVGSQQGLTVTGEHVSNNGSITLIQSATDWTGLGPRDPNTISLVDEQGNHNYSFKFNNFQDLKGNSSIINDPDLFSGHGWLNHSGEAHIYASDWLFIGHRVPEPSSLILMTLGLFALSRRKFFN